MRKRRNQYSLKLLYQDENENEEGDEDNPVSMETDSLEDQEVSNLASLSNTLGNSSMQSGSGGKGRKHTFFQVNSQLGK